MASTVSSSNFSANSFPHYGLDARSSFLKSIHLIQSVFNEIKYLLLLGYYRYISSPPQLRLSDSAWNEDSEGLIVFIHGLRTDPAAWFAQLSLIPIDTKIDLFAPVVHQRGMCSLEQAVTPLLPKIKDYTQKHPEKPICLLGTSNGGRIAAWLETELRESSPQTPVKVSSVAGVHFGSSRMALVDKLGISKWFYPNELRQELNYGSTKAHELLNRVRAPIGPSCAPRSYELFATREDLTIPDLDSTLPRLDKGEQFHIVHGVGHSSIVSAVAEKQMNSCFAWINSFN